MLEDTSPSEALSFAELGPFPHYVMFAWPIMHDHPSQRFLYTVNRQLSCSGHLLLWSSSSTLENLQRLVPIRERSYILRDTAPRLSCSYLWPLKEMLVDCIQLQPVSIPANAVAGKHIAVIAEIASGYV